LRHSLDRIALIIEGSDHCVVRALIEQFVREALPANGSDTFTADERLLEVAHRPRHPAAADAH